MSVETWVTRLAPEPFRDFLPYTTVSALKVIHPSQVLAKAVEVGGHFSSGHERARHAEQLRASLAQAGLSEGLAVLDRSPVGPLTASWDAPTSRLIGQRVLELYFHLLAWEGPLFLDLRPRYFSWDEQRRQLGFYPSSLWYRPDAEFMARVRALYAGFYRRDEAALARGIELYAWHSRPTAGFAARMEALLRDHFGPGETQDMRFSTAHFRATFDRIFLEVAESGAKLHADLPFLGVELIGLYLTLESLAVPLSPRLAFDTSLSGG